MSYRIYSIFGDPILAVPDNSSRQFRLDAWKRYQPFTIKRIVVQRTMLLLSLLNMDRFVCKIHKSPFGDKNIFAFQDWLAQISHEIKSPSAQPVIIWPPQRDRGRVYVHLLDNDHKSICFAKVSLDSKNDKLLSTEAHTLDMLAARQLKNCRVPNVIFSGQWKKHIYVVLEPLPLNARPLSGTLGAYPKSCINELSGRPHLAMLQEVETFDWWRHFNSLSDEALYPFCDELKRLVTSEEFLPVCRIHGDLGPANMIRANGQLWLFDWEESTANGPILSDKIGYDLAIHIRVLKKHPKQALMQFFERYFHGANPETRRDIMAALAFRYTIAPSITLPYIQLWIETYKPSEIRSYRNS